MSPRHGRDLAKTNHVQIPPVFPVHDVASSQEPSVVVLEARGDTAHRTLCLDRSIISHAKVESNAG
jgi:hypothetical protein